MTYWDPLPDASLVGPVRWPLLDFRGRWEERNWRNVPGPFYGAMTDNCWVGRTAAPRHFLYGDDEDCESEFIYRQPGARDELVAVLDGIWQDPYGGYGRDGDDRWTPEAVRAWWGERGRVHEWIDRKEVQWRDDEAPQVIDAVVGLRDYRSYLGGDLAEDLRGYLFWLDHRRVPRDDERLPDL